MKKIILLAAVLFSLINTNAQAEDFALTNLACESANGISLKTVALLKSGLKVEAEWGGFTKNFKAQLSQLGNAGAESTISLFDEQKNLSYLVQISLDADRSSVQNAKGALLGVTAANTTYKIAAIQCKVQVINTNW